MSPSTPHHNGIPPKLFEDLLLETLVFARQTAREDAEVATAVFGMIPSVVSLIVSLTLPQIRAVAASNARLFRIRWDGDREFWGDLLVVFRERDERAMATLRRQGKLLFCGELIESHQQQADSPRNAHRPLRRAACGWIRIRQARLVQATVATAINGRSLGMAMRCADNRAVDGKYYIARRLGRGPYPPRAWVPTPLRGGALFSRAPTGPTVALAAVRDVRRSNATC
jgi:hypothetical protein